MPADWLRDTLAGHIIRLATGRRILRYEEEKPGFQFEHARSSASSATFGSDATADEKGGKGEIKPELEAADDHTPNAPMRRKSSMKTSVNAEFVVPEGVVLVEWYGDNDPENPKRWSRSYRYWVCAQISILTFVSYGAAAIASVGEQSIMEDFGVGEVAVSMVLGIYLISWAVSPLFVCPLGELPSLGRNWAYAPFMVLFVALQFGAVWAPNFGALLAFRFLTGLCGAPALAAGGASMTDMVADEATIPVYFSFWAAGAVSGVAFSPVVASFAVEHYNNWRVSMLILLVAAALVTILITFCLPETLDSNILYRRAQRLRKLTGDERFRSQGEIEQSRMSARDLMQETLVRPTKIAIQDPSVLFSHLYMSTVYAVQYISFVGVPKLDRETYGFGVGIQGLTLTSLGVGCIVGMIAYLAYQYFYAIDFARRHPDSDAEKRLVPALIACFLPPFGLFIFAGCARSSVPWIGSLIGIAVFGAGIFVLFQCVFLYIALRYPKYASSILGGNDVLRSGFAGAMQPVGVVMYNNLGVQNAAIVCASILLVLALPLFLIYHYGEELRKRARFVG